MFEYKQMIYVRVLCIYLWLLKSMSLYKSDYVCVKALASVEGCIREKEERVW